MIYGVIGLIAVVLAVASVILSVIYVKMQNKDKSKHQSHEGETHHA